MANAGKDSRGEIKIDWMDTDMDVLARTMALAIWRNDRFIGRLRPL